MNLNYRPDVRNVTYLRTSSLSKIDMCTFISAYNRKKMIGPHSNLVYLSNAVSVIIFNRLRNKASCNWFQCLRFKNCLLWDKFESDLFSIEWPWILLSVSHKCGLIYLHFILFIILIILMKSANWARSHLNHISSCLFGFVMLLNISDRVFIYWNKGW